MMADEVCTEDTNILKDQIWALSTGFVCLVSAAGSFLAQENIRKVSGKTFLSACALFTLLFSLCFYLFMLLLQYSVF